MMYTHSVQCTGHYTSSMGHYVQWGPEEGPLYLVLLLIFRENMNLPFKLQWPLVIKELSIARFLERFLFLLPSTETYPLQRHTLCIAAISVYLFLNDKCNVPAKGSLSLALGTWPAIRHLWPLPYLELFFLALEICATLLAWLRPVSAVTTDRQLNSLDVALRLCYKIHFLISLHRVNSSNIP